jgi:hypothetical protein
MDRQLAYLVNRLTKTYGDRLVSVTLYGSAAGGNHHGKYSDLNVFCVLTTITPRELGESEPIFGWWRELGNPAPLLMTEQETRASTDTFPIEFQDMKDHRQVLYGKDIIAELEIGESFYRAQLEHELRVKLLRLRQQAAGILSDRDALLRLSIDSISTFCTLGRHALRIGGVEVKHSKREVVSALEQHLTADLKAFHTILDIREEKTAPQEVDPATLFGKYLAAIEDLVRFVDRFGAGDASRPATE